MVEGYKSIPISEIFESSECGSTFRPLLEWFISNNGKDRKGVAVVWNQEKDALEFAPDVFAQRLLDWSKQPGEDPYELTVMPDEALFRARLNNRAYFNFELGNLAYSL